MFKRTDEVHTFMDYLEEFIRARVNSMSNSSNMEDVKYLNQRRDNLQNYIQELCGIDVGVTRLDVYECPECGGEMIERKNRESGNRFWGCKKYPNCRGTRDADGLSKAEREEAKYKRDTAVQQSGFSFNKAKRDPANEVSPPVDAPFNPFSKR